MTETDFGGGWHPCNIVLDGYVFPSAENAFQSTRFTDPDIRASFQFMPASRAAYLGPKLKTAIPDWNDIKDAVMYEILKIKFRDASLMEDLLRTSGTGIKITNMRHENYWGSCQCARCHGRGLNRLGQLLEALRDDMLCEKQNTETECPTRTCSGAYASFSL